MTQNDVVSYRVVRTLLWLQECKVSTPPDAQGTNAPFATNGIMAASLFRPKSEKGKAHSHFKALAALTRYFPAFLSAAANTTHSTGRKQRRQLSPSPTNSAGASATTFLHLATSHPESGCHARTGPLLFRGYPTSPFEALLPRPCSNQRIRPGTPGKLQHHAMVADKPYAVQARRDGDPQPPGCNN